MKISLNCSGIADFRFPSQGLEDIKNSGFDYISLFTDERYAGNIKKIYEKNEVSKCCDFFERAVNEVLSKSRIKELNITMIRSPYLSGCKEKVYNEISHNLALKTLKICEEAKCKYAVIPPLFFDNRHKISVDNFEHYMSYVSVIKDSRTIILIENRCDQYNGHYVRGDFSNPHKLSDFVDELNNAAGVELFGVCLDTGDSNLCGTDLNEFITILGRRIKAVIVRDNDGVNDISLMPFSSVNKGAKTDWTGLLCGLRSIGFEGEIVFDITDSASSVPRILNFKILELTKSIGDYFIRQICIGNELKKYKTIVLFGAGNMCDKYMNSYGLTYPPVYICDNNKKRWGEKLFGLEIKDPAELLNLQDDGAILICNIYHCEIEAQIREMGVNNPILYFIE